ncbi:hypothetical protein ACQ4M3_18180 [Leptolyngbya sp. AN03gr2]|uniref:hypothetical protein n=1 Tax=unclassified Leptolyngbya TaxID=2650499 RepID=UPI003D31CB5F
MSMTDGQPLEEQLRQSTTQQRLNEAHRNQTVHRRAEDALDTLQADDLDEAARESVTQERHSEEQLREKAHLRLPNLQMQSKLPDTHLEST